MVVDGVREMVGSDRNEVLAAVRDARPETIAPVTFAADRRSVAIGAGDGRGNVLLVRSPRNARQGWPAARTPGALWMTSTGWEMLASLGSWNGSALNFAIEPPAPGEGVAVLVQATHGQMLGAAKLLGSARPVSGARSEE
jgi:hypothetical protein